MKTLHIFLEYPGIFCGFKVDAPSRISRNAREKCMRDMMRVLIKYNAIPHCAEDFVIEEVVKDGAIEKWVLGS